MLTPHTIQSWGSSYGRIEIWEGWSGNRRASPYHEVPPCIGADLLQTLILQNLAQNSSALMYMKARWSISCYHRWGNPASPELSPGNIPVPWGSSLIHSSRYSRVLSKKPVASDAVLQVLGDQSEPPHAEAGCATNKNCYKSFVVCLRLGKQIQTVDSSNKFKL